MEEQHQDLSDRLDALGRLILNGHQHASPPPDQTPMPPEKEKEVASQTLHITASHRVPCRDWCPCVCHASQKLKLAAPGLMESVVGKLFVGYSGMPVLNKPCDFKGCRDRQKATATMEYWFPGWFVAMNLKVYLAYLPRSGLQTQLSTTRRIPDDSQSIAFAMQGNIDGLKHLFSQGLITPRDVSNSRGFTLMRVSQTKHS